MNLNTSSTGLTANALMSQVEKILKDKQLSSGTDITEPIRDGKSSILTKPKRYQERDLMKTSVSTETDHSISDQDFQ